MTDYEPCYLLGVMNKRLPEGHRQRKHGRYTQIVTADQRQRWASRWLQGEYRTPFHFTFTKPITPDTDAIHAIPSPFLVFLRKPSQLYPLAQSTLAQVWRVIRNTTPNSSHCEFHSPKAWYDPYTKYTISSAQSSSNPSPSVQQSFSTVSIYNTTSVPIITGEGTSQRGHYLEDFNGIVWVDFDSDFLPQSIIRDDFNHDHFDSVAVAIRVHGLTLLPWDDWLAGNE